MLVNRIDEMQLDANKHLFDVAKSIMHVNCDKSDDELAIAAIQTVENEYDTG